MKINNSYRQLLKQIKTVLSLKNIETPLFIFSSVKLITPRKFDKIVSNLRFSITYTLIFHV